MRKYLICLVACLVFSGCETQADRDKLAADQRHFQDTIAAEQHRLDEKLIDAEMKSHQMKQGDKAACRWLKKEHPSTNEGRSWKEACTAIYGIKF